METVFAGGDVAAMAALLARMRASLALVGHVPEFAGGLQRLNVRLLNPRHTAPCPPRESIGKSRTCHSVLPQTVFHADHALGSCRRLEDRFQALKRTPFPFHTDSPFMRTPLS